MIEKKYTVAFVDDNPIEMRFIELFVNDRPELVCVWIENDPIQALDRLLKESVDILFLDIDMPGLNGVELVNALKVKPIVIVCSNHNHFAYETSLIQSGYLPKITSPEIFNKTIDRALLEFEYKNNHTERINRVVSIPTSKRDGSYFILDVENMVYASIEDKTISFFFNDGTTKQGNISMDSLINQLPAYFIRVHKSYLINLNYVEEFNLSIIKLKKLDHKIPIGRTFIKNVKRLFKGSSNSN